MPMQSLNRMFSFRMPQITMGLGARRALSTIIQAYGRRLCVVADSGIASQPAFAEVIDALRADGLTVRLFCDVPPDPPLSAVKQCEAAAREAKADALLAIGGGSVLDVAKVVGVLLTQDVALESLFGTDQIPGKGVPVVLAPTTAGTGSEVTPIAVLSDEAANLKRGIVSDFLLADHAVIDPQLCRSLPPGPTAYTGMDTLTHAIEAYTNRFAVPLVDGFALESIRLVSRNLLRAFQDGADEQARYGMSLASMLGGMCLRSVNTAAVHALAYPLGGRFHVPHGVANSLLLPHVMRFNMPSVADRYHTVAEAMGAEDAVAAIGELSRAIGTDRRMREFGIEEKHLPEMAAAAFQVKRLLDNNPRPLSETDILKIYQEAW